MTHRWGTGARDRTGTAEHKKQRQRILRRDRHQCQLRYAGICTLTATEMDHRSNVAAGGTDDDENMQAVCHQCHARKSSLEGVAARKANQSRRRQRLTLPTTPHPGLV